MAENDAPSEASPAESGSTSPPTPDVPQISTTPLSDQSSNRPELVARARTFLSSPQIQNQDIFSKRKFLLEKGLHEPEIELLLRELPPQLPRVPPRTYPQPPPSGLLTLLIGLARLFSWIAGGSAALLYVYHRLLLPRIMKTAEARKSLKSHQVSLLRNLNTSLAALKETQTDSFVPLPRPDPHKEPSAFAGSHSLVDVLQEAETLKLEPHKLPPLTLLRCAWEDFRRLPDCAESNPKTEELFQVLESRIPWLVSEEGIAFEHILWETLSNSSVFGGVTPADSPEGLSMPVQWVYTSPEPVTPSPLVSSLDSLSSAISEYKRTPNPNQHTLQAMSEFTGYISSQMYTPYRPPSIVPGSTGSSGEPADELKKEIRALKGLALNRRVDHAIRMSSSPANSVPQEDVHNNSETEYSSFTFVLMDRRPSRVTGCDAAVHTSALVE